MTADTLPFASAGYFWLLALLVFARGMDLLSTWVATPTLAMEGNPIAKRLGWKLNGVMNVAICFGCAFWPLAAVIVATTGVLVASHNFRLAWLARTMGEWGVGTDAVSALDCWAFDLPGFQGMKIAKGSIARMGYTPSGYADTGGSYKLHFPDGNATIARLLVRNLIPRAVPGHGVADVVDHAADLEAHPRQQHAHVAAGRSPECAVQLPALGHRRRRGRDALKPV